MMTRPATRISKRFAFATLLAFLSMTGACGLAMDNEDLVNRASEAYANGDYRAAIIDTKNVLLDEPDNVAARELLGRASVEIGDAAAGESELRRALELGAEQSAIIVDLGRALLLQLKLDAVVSEIQPDLVDDPALKGAIYRLRGNALTGLGQLDDARSEFGQALQLNDADIEAQLGMVQTYIAERNFLQARDMLDQIVAFDATHVPSKLASGALSLTVRDSQRAIAEYQAAAELARASGDTALEISALAGLAESHFVENDVEPARPVLTRMRELAAEDVRTVLVESRIAIADEDWITAQESLQGILQADPEQRFAQYLLGIVQKERGNLAQAEMYLSAVVSASPNNVSARRNLAEVRLQLNKAGEARADLESVVSDPNADARSLAMAADANLLLGDIDRAELLLERAVAENPEDFSLKLQLAVAYLRAGRPQDAQSLMESVSNPEGSDAEFQQGQIIVVSEMAQGNSEAAVESARSFLERWPARVEAHGLLGSILVSAGDLAEARKSFGRALEVDAEYIPALRSLAQLDEAEQDFEGAIDRYSQILEIRPTDVQSMVSLARVASQSERYSDAISWLEKARDTDESAFAPRLVLGVAYAEMRNFEKSIQLATEAIEINPDSARAHGVLGQSFLGQSNFARAEEEYAEAAELDPANAIYVLNLAKTRAMGGDRQAALRTLESNPDLSMSHVPSAVALANLKAQHGDIQGALDIANRLEADFPQDASVRSLAAELELSRGNGERAVEIYDEVLTLDKTSQYSRRAYQVRARTNHEDPIAPLLDFLDERPLDISMRSYLANAYYRAGEFENAAEQYEIVIEQNPDDLLAINNLAVNYHELGDERAEEIARRAYELRADHPAVMDTLGWILVDNGKVEEGLEVLRQASTSRPDDPNIGFHLASGLVAAGDTAEARRILEVIIARNSEFRTRADAEALLLSL